MESIFYESGSYSFWIFLCLTLLIGGGASWSIGKMVSKNWFSSWKLLLYVVPLAFGIRFLYFALYQYSLFSFYYFMINLLFLFAIACISYRISRSRQMVNQYPWLFKRSGFFSWKEIS